MTTAQYKISELPNGTYRIEMLSEGNWLWSKTPEPYKTMDEAEKALKRLISNREWLYDEEGNPL